MEPIHTYLHARGSIAEETIDTTNKRIRRVIHFNVFYDETQVDPEAISNGIIGVEEVITFPGEEEHIYHFDDAVWIAAHKIRIHLSRELPA